jgi:thioredoxin reductase
MQAGSCRRSSAPGRERAGELPGALAAGDVRYGSIKRVAAAVGEGSVAVGSAHQYLTTTVPVSPQ